MIKFLITRIAVWASGLKADDFRKIIGWVNEANEDERPSNYKKAIVETCVCQAFPGLSGWVINLLIELAVALVKRNQSA